MDGILDRPQEGDGEGVAAVIEKADDVGPESLLVQRHQDPTDRVDALHAAHDPPAGDQRLGFEGVGELEHVLRRLAGSASGAAHHAERVLVPPGRQQTNGRAALLDDDVGGDRRPVRDQPQPVEHILGVAKLLGRRLQAAEESRLEVVARGAQGLAVSDPSILGDHHCVGERAADVDSRNDRRTTGILDQASLLLNVPRRSRPSGQTGLPADGRQPGAQPYQLDGRLRPLRS